MFRMLGMYSVVFFLLVLQIRGDIRQEALQNNSMFGGDMAGGISVPEITNSADGPVMAFVPNTNYKLWTGGVLYYEYDATATRNDQVLSAAIQEIHDKTCLRVYPRNGQASITSYVRITTTEPGCWSYVGMKTTGSQQLNLSVSGCWYVGTVIHELLHAFGFNHEHQRYDRNTYVTIQEANVEAGALS
ncbi:unnamed protein product [Notodromas monacha]|uniref:Metalloendopeptidase n=1 Tax=Notodromas monacha TaxID=399045 RepID=A0A7R9GKI8_9CRUS|nr:unnamed protein product [Notodromas monacha]CAG0924656.1 unnamed protein product [Notodromas monacha]